MIPSNIIPAFVILLNAALNKIFGAIENIRHLRYKCTSHSDEEAAVSPSLAISASLLIVSCYCFE